MVHLTTGVTRIYEQYSIQSKRRCGSQMFPLLTYRLYELSGCVCSARLLMRVWNLRSRWALAAKLDEVTENQEQNICCFSEGVFRSEEGNSARAEGSVWVAVDCTNRNSTERPNSDWQSRVWPMHVVDCTSTQGHLEWTTSMVRSSQTHQTDDGRAEQVSRRQSTTPLQTDTLAHLLCVDEGLDRQIHFDWSISGGHPCVNTAQQQSALNLFCKRKGCSGEKHTVVMCL